jgi:hypothetical protein
MRTGIETLKLVFGYFKRSVASSEMATYLMAFSKRLLASDKSESDSAMVIPLLYPVVDFGEMVKFLSRFIRLGSLLGR